MHWSRPTPRAPTLLNSLLHPCTDHPRSLPACSTSSLPASEICLPRLALTRLGGNTKEVCHTRQQGSDDHIPSEERKGSTLPGRGHTCHMPIYISQTNRYEREWHSSSYYLQVNYMSLVFSLLMLSVTFATLRVIAQKLCC